MTALSDVYAKFGEVAEAAQLLETEVGNMLLLASAAEHGLLSKPDPALARKVFREVDRKTLGQLISATKAKVPTPESLQVLLERALYARNCLNHAFYRDHNFRRNSVAGRALMLSDLDQMHEEILGAYKALMQLSGVEFEMIGEFDLPSDHLPL